MTHFDLWGPLDQAPRIPWKSIESPPLEARKSPLMGFQDIASCRPFQNGAILGSAMKQSLDSDCARSGPIWDALVELNMFVFPIDVSATQGSSAITILASMLLSQRTRRLENTFWTIYHVHCPGLLPTLLRGTEAGLRLDSPSS